MNGKPFSRNSPTREVPNRKIPRMTWCFRAAAVSAHVERLLNTAAVVSASHADQALDAAVRDPGEHRRQALEAHRTMLRVHQQPVVAAVRELFGDRRAMRIQEQSQLGRPGTQLL